MKKVFLPFLVAFFIIFIDVSPVFAQAGRGGNTTIEVTCGDNGDGIDTAIGCIPYGNATDFTAFILRWAIGVGGGIAFLLILVAGFQIMTASGDPKKLQAGRELLTSAVAGIIMIIFSVFLLRIIGVNILGIIPTATFRPEGFVPRGGR